MYHRFIRMRNFIFMKRKTINFFLFFLFSSFTFFNMQAQTVMPLYDGEIPNSRPTVDQESFHYETGGILIIENVSRPSLTIFLPPKEKATGAAVIICPGGGYTNLAAGHEGSEVARRFNQSGIAAFVLKYRIPNDNTMINKETAPCRMHSAPCWSYVPGRGNGG